MMKVLGPGSDFIQPISRELGVKIGMRGDTLLFRGEPEAVGSAIKLVDQLTRVCRGHKTLKEADVVRGARILAENPSAQLGSIFNDVIHVTSSRRLITPRGLAQKQYVDTIRNRDLTFGIGPAGTGKTYLAVAVAVNELLAGRFKRIILTRPAVEAGEKLGFLPGDMVEKINPYVRPLHDALNDMMDGAKTQELMATGQIEIAPLAFMRGRTLNDSFVILDEAQNTTRAQMKMFLTRLGYSSKAVVTGDVTQVDLPHSTVSGLVDARRVLANVEGIGFCYFSDMDVVRHELVQRIILAYEKTESTTANKQSDREANHGENQSE
ncbi:MAG: PhoH family protein [Deltaproteobacteria bacterium]|nr:PhoH family protein [Deltaproteobacteria bacterium]